MWYHILQWYCWLDEEKTKSTSNNINNPLHPSLIPWFDFFQYVADEL